MGLVYWGLYVMRLTCSWWGLHASLCDRSLWSSSVKTPLTSGSERLDTSPLRSSSSNLLKCPGFKSSSNISESLSRETHRIKTHLLSAVLNNVKQAKCGGFEWISPLLLSDCLSSWSSLSFLLTRFWTAHRTTFIAFSNRSENSMENGWERAGGGHRD